MLVPGRTLIRGPQDVKTLSGNLPVRHDFSSARPVLPGQATCKLSQLVGCDLFETASSQSPVVHRQSVAATQPPFLLRETVHFENARLPETHFQGPLLCPKMAFHPDFPA
jgi:hypothetical protein